MKTSILKLILLLNLCCFATGAFAAKPGRLKYDSLSCLQIEGIVKNAHDSFDSECIVELLGPDASVDTIILKEGKRKFKFVLTKNTYYAIRVSKKGYISKIVSINTEIITPLKGVHIFEFETTLLKEAVLVKLNKDILDFPVAIIHYDYEKETFSYNKEYSAYIKRELYNTRPSYYKPVKKETLSPLASAHN